MDLLLHPSDQPVFRLGVQAHGCQLEIRLNDVPVFRDAGDTALCFEMPVNEWLFSGSNRISVLVSPLPGTKARASIRMNYKRLRQPLKNALEVGALNWETREEAAHGHDHNHDHLHSESETEWPQAPALSEPVEAGQLQAVFWEALPPGKGSVEGSVRLQALLALPLPWPVCPWNSGADLSGQGGLLAFVQSLSTKFWQTVQSRKANGMLQFAAARAKDIAQVYHLRESEVAEALLFPKLMASQDWQAQDLPKKGVVIELAGEGRLVRLIREDDGQSPLRLINEKAGVEAVIDAWWTFTSGWVLIR